MIVKNVLGVVFALAGIAMLVLPGQGIVTILISVVLLDFPKKFAFERWLIRRRLAHRAMNWIRLKAGRPPLQIPSARAQQPDVPSFAQRRAGNGWGSADVPIIRERVGYSVRAPPSSYEREEAPKHCLPNSGTQFGRFFEPVGLARASVLNRRLSRFPAACPCRSSRRRGCIRSDHVHSPG